MTITIAAISIGIAVDDTIHYVYRFTSEFHKDRDYWAAVDRSHATIGRAMYYTSITITLGFSILALSNFVPTIYFGLLTGFAMLVALLANLTLLPLLIVRLQPLGEKRHPKILKIFQPFPVDIASIQHIHRHSACITHHPTAMQTANPHQRWHGCPMAGLPG